MTLLEALAVFAAGAAAGTVNTVVGSGTLITFPVLLGVGYSPVTANVSNNVGLVPGGISAVLGYRRELAGQGARVRRFAIASVTGAAAGSTLLLVLPEAAFKAIVPFFIVVALGLVVLQPRLAARMAARSEHRPHRGGPVAFAAVFAAGVYGGYFGAAQGILLIAILGLALDDELQNVNAVKNVLATLVNGVSAVIFIAVADIAWEVVGLIAAGSILGAQLGARYGRRLPAGGLRAVIVVVGLAAVAQLTL